MIPGEIREYDIVPYNPDWPRQYEVEAAVVRHVFGDLALDIQHIGSTSIPGMYAKPQIDIMVICQVLADADQLAPYLETVGYVAYGDPFNQGARMFSREAGRRKLTNIHVRVPEDPYIQEFVLIRDYLRLRPDRAKAYSELKMGLKQQFPQGYIEYRRGKKALLNELSQEAKTFFQTP